MSTDTGKRKLAAVMFADIRGYTALLSVDEAKALAFVDEFKSTLIEKTKKYTGDVIEFYGDGSLSVYDSAVDAVKCAIEMQKALRQGETVPVRIGIHMGDIVMKDDTVFGDGVNVAARIESMGVAGNILVSPQVNKAIFNQQGIDTTPMGTFKFKNVKEPMDVFAIKHPDVYTPAKTELQGAKGRRVFQLKIWQWIALTIAVMSTTFVLYNSGVFKTQKEIIQEEKIAVPTFKNYTGNPELNFIGELTAHLVTKELIKTENANVIDFYTEAEISQLSAGGAKDLSQQFAKQSGAINIVDGSFEEINEDSISFSAFIKNLEDGSIRHAFQSVAFPKSNPKQGIAALANAVKGYWDTKDAQLRSVPNFDAYKYYMKARNNWDDHVVMHENLQLAIKADSSFIDPMFLLLGHYYNRQEYEEATELISKLRNTNETLSTREQNQLDCYDAIVKGQNQKAYAFTLKTLENNTQDYFISTELLIFASQLVNDPYKAIEIFESTGIEGVDLENCPYCIERNYAAIACYIHLDQFEKAKTLIDELPQVMSAFKYYSIQTKYYVKNKDHDGVRAVMDKVKNYSDDVDPRLMYYATAREYFLVGDVTRSKAYAQELFEEYPEPHWTHAWGDYYLGNYKESLDRFDGILEAGNFSYVASSMVGVLHAMLGNTDAANDQISTLESLKQPYGRGVVPYSIAKIQLHLGLEKEALDNLELAVEEGAFFTINNTFENDPALQPLKDNPRFQEIIHPLGLPASEKH